MPRKSITKWKKMWGWFVGMHVVEMKRLLHVSMPESRVIDEHLASKGLTINCLHQRRRRRKQAGGESSKEREKSRVFWKQGYDAGMRKQEGTGGETFFIMGIEVGSTRKQEGSSLKQETKLALLYYGIDIKFL